MKDVIELLNNLGISKVKLAKYLGVSRQMLYNYLAMERIEDIPIEKSTKILGLLGVESYKDISDIKLTNEYISGVEKRLNDKLTDCSDNKTPVLNVGDLSKKQQESLNEIFNLLKEKMLNDKNKDAMNVMRYLCNFLQSIDNNPELKYVLAYFSKSLGFTEPLEFVFNEKQQFVFESIMFSGMNLYTSGGASRSRIAETHKKFVQEIEHKKEERLSRTQELNATKIQALRELGYKEINMENAKEVIDKIAEIESRKV